MTATIPPTSAPSRRRRAEEKPRTAKRRAPERNRTEDATVDKSMPKTTRGTDTGRARKADAPPRSGGRTPKADPATPGTRRSAKARTATRTKGAEKSRAVPGARGAEKTRAKGAEKSRKARGAVDAERTRAVPGTRPAERSREKRGAAEADGTRAVPGAKRAERSRTAPEAKRADKARTAPGAKRTDKAGTAPGAKRADEARTAAGAKRAEKARGERARAVPGAKPAGKVREGARGAQQARAVARTVAAPRARTPFVLLIVGLLAGALVSLLLLNTVLAQDAFTLSELQHGNHQLGERKQALQEEVDRESSPQGLHARARSLGMRDVPRPAFIDARTGRVIEGGVRPPGVPDDAVAAAGATAVTGVPGAIVPPPRTARTDGGTR